MIRFLLKRTKFHRTALMLFAMVLTTTTAWAETIDNVEYIGENGELQTIEDYTVLTVSVANDQLGTDGEKTWYYVKDKLDLEGII